MQLRNLPLLWRDTTSVQIGTDPRWAVVLADLSPPAARALLSLPPGATTRVLRSALLTERVGEPESRAVLDHLRAAHLLVDPPRSAPLGPDARTWALLDEAGDAASAAARRSRFRVRIVGLGRLGACLAHELALAGVGTLELDDPAPVTAAEVGFGGLTHRDRGESRQTAVARSVHTARPAIRTSPADRRAPDLVVLVDHGGPDPIHHVPLRDAGVTHLSVVISEASVTVGPLVVPGRSACLTCVDLHRADADAHWPTVAAQLATAPEFVEETSLALLAGALAAAEVLAHIDGRPNRLRNASLQVALPDPLPRTHSWLPHPDCRCGSQLALGEATDH